MMAVVNEPKLNNPPEPENREGFSPVLRGDIIRVPWMDGRPYFQVELLTTDGFPRIIKDGLYHTIHQYEKVTKPMKKLGGQWVPAVPEESSEVVTPTTTAPTPERK